MKLRHRWEDIDKLESQGKRFWACVREIFSQTLFWGSENTETEVRCASPAVGLSFESVRRQDVIATGVRCACSTVV
jgi:hypothetical protein